MGRFTLARLIEDPEWVLSLNLAFTTVHDSRKLQYDPSKVHEHTALVFSSV
jgi:hypothetical protein